MPKILRDEKNLVSKYHSCGLFCWSVEPNFSERRVGPFFHTICHMQPLLKFGCYKNSRIGEVVPSKVHIMPMASYTYMFIPNTLDRGDDTFSRLAVTCGLLCRSVVLNFLKRWYAPLVSSAITDKHLYFHVDPNFSATLPLLNISIEGISSPNPPILCM